MSVIYANPAPAHVIDGVNMEHEQFELPPPAVFDVNASLNAKPVELIRPVPVDSWRRRLRQSFLIIRIRAFVLVIIAGLSVGAFAGTVLVKHKDNMVASETSQTTQASELRTTVDVGVTGVASPSLPSRFGRRHRHPRWMYRPGQAYRVTVIDF